MRLIFYTYIISYILIAIVIQYGETSMLVSKCLYSLALLLLGFVVMAPIAVIINPKVIKSHKSDQKYLNLCFAAGLFRIIFLACGPFGLRDYMLILFLNAFGLLIFAFLESKFKRISNEYFKY